MPGPAPVKGAPSAPSKPEGPLGAGKAPGASTGSSTKRSADGSGVSAREATSSQLLRMSWDYGYAPRSAEATEPPPAAEALAVLAGGDERPLLVLRECESCAGTEDAFLSREFDNERTILLGRWFHAVKLGPEVLEPNHPFHALFAGKQPPHLFVTTADGRTRTNLDGGQSQSKLWRAMTGVLAKSYRKNPEAAVRALQRVLDKLDESDRRLAELDERMLSERTANGAEAPDVRDIQAEIDAALAARIKLLEEGRELEDLQLRTAPEPP